MKPTRFFALLTALIAGVIMVTFNSCSKNAIPILTSSYAFDITETTAKVKGEVTDDGDASITERGACYDTLSNPSINNNNIKSGSGLGAFDCILTGLNQRTQYYYKTYAINSAGVGYSEQKSVYIHGPCPGMPTITYAGQVYNTVLIGNQCWLKENLKTTKYRDGSAIPNVTDKTAWSNLTTGAYCNNNNDENNSITYGRLYNWYAVETGNLCPSGWHVPFDWEWTTLTDYLGGINVAGGKLKETGTTHWWKPNIGATNESGFTGLPGGHRAVGGYFTIGGGGCFWSASSSISSSAWIRALDYNKSRGIRGQGQKQNGFSVRCLKD